MLVIGLTGGIASGKSTVAAMLKDLGAAVIDADQVARAVVEPGQPAWHDIRSRFGPGYFLPDGQLNRRALAELVFADAQALADLNRITHPRIRERVGELKAALAAQGAAVLVLEAPLLIETGMYQGVDQVWLAAAPEDVRVRRLTERDRLSEARARQRLAAQMPQAEKLKYAHAVIDTGCSLAETRAQVEAAWRDRVIKAL